MKNTWFLDRTSVVTLCLSTALMSSFVSVAFAFEGVVSPEAVQTEPDYSPFVGRSYPDQVLFGDLHFHTEISFDAGLIGTSLNIHDAFQVARGERIISNTGQPVQLIRPLDFLAITEHAELLGLSTAIRTSHPNLLADEWGRRIHDGFTEGSEARMAAFSEIIELATVRGIDPTDGLDLDGDIWLDIVETVD